MSEVTNQPGDDTLGVAVRDAEVGPPKMAKRLWVLYPLAMIGINAVWGGTSVLLGKQVAYSITDPVAAAGALGTILAVGAASSLIAPPVLGRLSDRTPTRFLGRRNVWIFGSAIVAAIGLIIMSLQSTLIAIAIAWVLVMWPLNGVQTALTAVLPERVPVRLRASLSGIVGSTTILGVFAGITIAGLTTSLTVGYIGLATLMLSLSLVFAFGTKDYTPPIELSAVPKDVRKAASKFPGFRTAPNFWWTFVGRFAIMLGYYLTFGFLLYILKDYIKVGDGSVQAASETLVLIQGISTLALMVAATLGGFLADRFDRTRLFTAVTGALIAPAALVFLFFPTVTGAIIAGVILGIAFGSFLAVDQALISRVLPGTENAARDMGIMNIANALPQVIGPAAAGFVVALTGGYQPLFVAAVIVVLLGAVAIRFIRGIR